jgi:hypothetical protein
VTGHEEVDLVHAGPAHRRPGIQLGDGDLRVSFRGLVQGPAYGLCWSH